MSTIPTINVVEMAHETILQLNSFPMTKAGRVFAEKRFRELWSEQGYGDDELPIILNGNYVMADDGCGYQVILIESKNED